MRETVFACFLLATYSQNIFLYTLSSLPPRATPARACAASSVYSKYKLPASSGVP